MSDTYAQQCIDAIEAIRDMIGAGYGDGHQPADLFKIVNARNTAWLRELTTYDREMYPLTFDDDGFKIGTLTVSGPVHMIVSGPEPGELFKIVMRDGRVFQLGRGKHDLIVSCNSRKEQHRVKQWISEQS